MYLCLLSQHVNRNRFRYSRSIKKIHLSKTTNKKESERTKTGRRTGWGQGGGDGQQALGDGRRGARRRNFHLYRGKKRREMVKRAETRDQRPERERDRE